MQCAVSVLWGVVNCLVLFRFVKIARQLSRCDDSSVLLPVARGIIFHRWFWKLEDSVTSPESLVLLFPLSKNPCIGREWVDGVAATGPRLFDSSLGCSFPRWPSHSLTWLHRCSCASNHHNDTNNFTISRLALHCGRHISTELCRLKSHCDTRFTGPP